MRRKIVKSSWLYGLDNLLKDATELVEESLANGSLRTGNWKYIPASEQEHSFIADSKAIASGYMNKPQLFDLSTDPSENYNLAGQHPDKVEKMDIRLKQIITSGY